MKKALKLTEASMTLLLAIHKDLPNWDNCTPAENHLDAVKRGNLMDLKKKKLVASFKDEGKEWLTLTDAGKKLAKLALGDVGPVEKKKPKTTKKKAANVNVASWLVGRLRNALHKTRPQLKEGKTLKEVATLSDIRELPKTGLKREAEGDAAEKTE